MATRNEGRKITVAASKTESWVSRSRNPLEIRQAPEAELGFVKNMLINVIRNTKKTKDVVSKII